VSIIPPWLVDSTADLDLWDSTKIKWPMDHVFTRGCMNTYLFILITDTERGKIMSN
jgi:hypothetical protein